ncbi:MAG: hypothetical protein K6G00_05395 [Treponema sp.]|nr:hypothetical protein [Treponema sp.]
MFNIKTKFKFFLPVLIFTAIPISAAEEPYIPKSYVASDAIVSTDKNNDSKKSLQIEMFAGHQEENWYLNFGYRMQEDIFDFAGNIGLKDLYFKNYPIQIGSALEGYYHIKFFEVGKFEQNMFAAASYFLNLVPTDTRITVYFGAGLKGNYLAVSDHNPPLWNAYPIVSIFITQNFAKFLTLNAGIRTFSYFVSTAFIEPQFFANIDLHFTPKFSIYAGIEGIYNSYRKLEDLKGNLDSLKLQKLNFNAGIKYLF